MKFLIIVFSLFLCISCRENVAASPNTALSAASDQTKCVPASDNCTTNSTLQPAQPSSAVLPLTSSSAPVIKNTASSPVSSTASSTASPVYKRVCLTNVDKNGNKSTRCTLVRIHQKYNGTQVPVKK